MPERPIVVTLTATPPRFPNLARKFRAIEKQTRKPDHIELNIPVKYRRFPGEVPSLPALPDWVTIRRCTTDYGPATKVLPTAQHWRGQDVDLLLCDDDRLPDRLWIERLAKARQDRPNDIITERGWNIDERFGIEKSAPDLPRSALDPIRGRILSYQLKRLLSLSLWHPPRKVVSKPGYVDIFEGFLGALVPPGAIPEKALVIPDVIWAVDDVWLSGMAYVNGARVWAHDLPRPVISDGHFDKLAALHNFVVDGHGRADADRHAVEYLRREHGAWP